MIHAINMIHARRENRLSLTHLRHIANNKKIDITTYAQEEFPPWSRPAATRIMEAFRNTLQPEQLFDILQLLDEKKLIKNPLILRAAESISNNYLNRLRDLECFSVSTQNARQQYKMLIRHLFANYRVPEFMEYVWLNGKQNRYQEWFRHIGIGNSLRTAPGLPDHFTKKMAHHFCQSPAHFSVEEAVRSAQLYGIGGDKRLVDAIRRTRLVLAETFTDDDDDDAFWLSLLRYLSAHPQLDQRSINLIVEYIWDIRFVPCRIIIAGGGERSAAPRYQQFCLNGKSLKSLLDDAQAWHNNPLDDRVVGFEWKPSKNIEPFRFVQGKKTIWEIKELLSSSALIEEGNALSHCVGQRDYAEACYDGGTSIWSLGRSSGTGFEKLLTIQVEIADEDKNRVVEIRGIDNRLPREEDELTIIKFWSLLNDLDVDT